MAPPPAHDSAVAPCLRGCVPFPQRHSPPVSFLPSLGLPPCNQQGSLSWDCPLIPVLQRLAAIHSHGLESFSGVWRSMAWIARIILTPFRLSQISGFTLHSRLCSAECPGVGISALHQVQLWFCSPSSSFPFPPSSYRILRGSVYYFPWSGTPASFQLVLCEIVFTYRCSWCIHGERCAPCPPTPTPACLSLTHTNYSLSSSKETNINLFFWLLT